MCKTDRVQGEPISTTMSNSNGTTNGTMNHHHNNNGDANNHTHQETLKKSTQPKHHGLAHLAMCALGICICYLYYGILQERLFTGRQRLGASFVLVTQCVTNAIVAYIWLQIERSNDKPETNNEEPTSNGTRSSVDTNNNSQTQQQHRSLNHWLLFFTSGFYVVAMASSNEAIQYVSYPVAVLAKSCKLIPTMLVGQVLEGKLYSTSEWIAALLISAGIVIFHLTRHVAKGTGVTGGDDDHSTYGMALLLCSLAMDGVLSSCQNFIKYPRKPDRHRPPTAVETMLYMNIYAVAYLAPLCVQNGQWADGVARLSGEDSLVTAILILNATVALGQIFIFLCITWFSPVVTTTITTTRKFLTIVVSVLMFGHSFTPTQWFAVLLVFSGLYLIIAVQRSKSRTRVEKREKTE